MCTKVSAIPAVTSHNEKTAKLGHRSFFFCLEEIAELKDQLPTHLRTWTKVEILVACLWKCRTIALGLGFNQEIALSMAVNARTKFSPPLPLGYYGNAFGKPAVMSTAGELSPNSLGYGKAEVTHEFMRSRLDQLERDNKPTAGWHKTNFVCIRFEKTEVCRCGFRLGKSDVWWPNRVQSPIDRNVQIVELSMEKFAKEIGKIIKCTIDSRSTFLKSPL